MDLKFVRKSVCRHHGSVQHRALVRGPVHQVLLFVHHSRHLLLVRGQNADSQACVGRDRVDGHLFSDLHHQQQLQGLAGPPRGDVRHAEVDRRNRVSGNHPLPHGRHQVRRRRKRVLSFENARRNL